MNRRWLPLCSAVFLIAFGSTLASAQVEVWSGRTFAFAKGPFANPTLPQNQDHITTHCWITRGNTMGIYNIALESAYTHYVSPSATLWATGDAVNHASLSFKDWEDWAQSYPPLTVGVKACMLIVDGPHQIYLDIMFTSWGQLTGGGGAFSYVRALPPVVPTQPTSWGRIKQLYR